MTDVTRVIHDAVNVACPGSCVSIGDFNDRLTWRIDPPVGATQQQIDAANLAMQTIDLSPASLAAIQVSREKADADEFMTSSDSSARSVRSMARVIYAAIAAERTSINSLLDILKSGRFPTTQEANALKLPVRTWAQLISAAKAENASEVNPNITIITPPS